MTKSEIRAEVRKAVRQELVQIFRTLKMDSITEDETQEKVQYRKTLRKMVVGEEIFLETPWRSGVSLDAWFRRWKNAARRITQTTSMPTRKYQIRTETFSRDRSGVYIECVQ